MESLILLHNNLYPKSSYILMQNIQELLQKLQVPVEKSYNLTLEEKFLPFMERVKYYKKLFLLFLEAENHKILVCDSQSLLEIGRFFQTLYEETELREILLKECGAEVDILSLENRFIFAPEIIFNALKTFNFKRRWEGFRCAFLIDRKLEKLVIESQIIPTLEDITGLKILPFFKESYAYLLQTNPQLAYKMGGMDYYEMMDSGVDFILTPNIGNFELMDRHIKNLQDSMGRDTAEIPLLFIPQVILALFNEMTKDTLRFGEHIILPRML